MSELQENIPEAERKAEMPVLQKATRKPTGKMNAKQAQAEAVKRYGPTAYAQEHPAPDHFYSVGVIVTPPGWRPKDGELKRRYGWGATWEEAFELAQQRLKENANEHTPEHTAETGKTFTQGRLFP